MRTLPLPKSGYFEEVYPKKQIFLYSTVSGPSPHRLLRQWDQAAVRRGSAFVVAGRPFLLDSGYAQGEVFRCFPEKYWGIYLSLQMPANQISPHFKTLAHSRLLEKHSIGIGICHAGALSLENGRFFSSFRMEVPEDEVFVLEKPFRAKTYFQRISDHQIAAIAQLVKQLCETYEIPSYNLGLNAWELNESALNQQAGVYAKSAVRADLAHLHPQPDLLEALSF